MELHRSHAPHPLPPVFFFTDPATTELYTLTLHDALPIYASVSLLPNGGKMLLGTDISAVLSTLEALDVDVIGLNCSTGPEDMRDAIRFLGEHSSKPIH